MSYQNPFDFENPLELLIRLFGTQIDTYLLEPEALRKRFGEWVRKIRLEKTRPRNYNGRTSHMTEAVFAMRFNAAWWHLFHQICSKGERWVRKLEAGEVPLNPGIIMCVAMALNADELESALLLEAAGWNGWMGFILRRLVAELNICNIVEDETSLTLAEVKHLLQLQLEVSYKEAYRVLSNLFAS